jgi:hypothetical protein
MQILDFVVVHVLNNIDMLKLDVSNLYITLNIFLKQEKVAFGSSMTSLLQKLMKKQSSSRLITAFHPLHTPNPIASLNQERDLPTELLPTSPILTHQFAGSSSTTLIFPSFPFGFASKPVFENGFLSNVSEDTEFEDARTLWADSTKKKRKKKMNKHKYQKLRKRVRRQT